MEANGAAGFSGNPWYLIGPFDNQGLDHPWPPEKAIDLAAHYPGKGEEAAWRKMSFPDAQVNDLKHFKQSDNCVCYLYRQIDMPAATKATVSLGSDDGIAVWLNGKRMLFDEAIASLRSRSGNRPARSQAGRNDLLLKISNTGGRLGVLFRPDSARSVLARLDRQLDRDFPPPKAKRRITGSKPCRCPRRSDRRGRPGVSARRQALCGHAPRRRVPGFQPDVGDPAQVAMRPYVRGLHEVLGLTNVGNDLYLVQRPEITLGSRHKGTGTADEFITVCDKFGLSGDYHEFIYGPARDKDGNLFFCLNVGFGGGHQSKVPYRGFCLKVTPKGEMIPWAYGLRSPNGMNFSPDGRLYYTDNQGEWIPACKLQEVRQGEFYGHAASVRWWPGKKDGELPEMTAAGNLVSLFHRCAARSTQPVWDTSGGKFGPFDGQCIVGELTESLLMHCNLEEVKGRMQGCVFLFRKGFECGPNRLAFAPDGSLFVAETNRGWGSVGGQPFGVQRVVWTGRVPFEIHSMCITPDRLGRAFHTAGRSGESRRGGHLLPRIVHLSSLVNLRFARDRQEGKRDHGDPRFGRRQDGEPRRTEARQAAHVPLAAQGLDHGRRHAAVARRRVLHDERNAVNGPATGSRRCQVAPRFDVVCPEYISPKRERGRWTMTRKASSANASG